ncbi:hypothetical protein [Candidatus Nitrosocosmicus sp. R]
MNIYFCRKVFATYLRNKGIKPEIIDLLQGRISSSAISSIIITDLTLMKRLQKR